MLAQLVTNSGGFVEDQSIPIDDRVIQVVGKQFLEYVFQKEQLSTIVRQQGELIKKLQAELETLKKQPEVAKEG